ncbi:MAG: response regulator [candidate division Zixibacteria bacterium]|nr:response regulator [candidate division Zixibacteria bacterium]
MEEGNGEVGSKSKELYETDTKIKFKILVVDDDENIREVLSDLLLLEGHEVLLADGGEQALYIFDQRQPDIVITDLGMPGISGWEVARRVKEKDPSRKVIVISGWGASLEEGHSLEVYVDQVLSKPFHLEQVKKVIAEVMSNS